MSELSIRQILDSVIRGQIRIPAFQRGYVWEPERVAYLMDSIYKGYPFGNLLFWRSTNKLKFERDLGPFKLPPGDPDFPIDYVLDGQQRITSIFSVFQTELVPDNPTGEWRDIYFDFSAEHDAQDSQFVALEDKDVNPEVHFPLKVLFNTVGYREATDRFPKDSDKVKFLDLLQAKFKEAKLPVQTISTEDKDTVAIVFERVNQRGVPLDTLQLLAAWTWSEEFDLLRNFEKLQETLEPFGFEEVGADSNLLIRCCAAILTGYPTSRKLMELNGAQIRDALPRVMNGLKGAVDFLKTNLNVYSVDVLPFSTLLIPLCVFFEIHGEGQHRHADTQRIKIERWFWRTCFTRRYSSAVNRNLEADIAAMKNLKADENDNSLGSFDARIAKDFFVDNEFRTGVVNTKTYVCMLAQNNPRSFISGNKIALDKVLQTFNRSEFHHIFPKTKLRDSYNGDLSHSCLANFCFLSRADNNQISNKCPSDYRKLMPNDITAIAASCFLPDNTFLDDFEKFVDARSDILLEYAKSLYE